MLDEPLDVFGNKCRLLMNDPMLAAKMRDLVFPKVPEIGKAVEKRYFPFRLCAVFPRYARENGTQKIG